MEVVKKYKRLFNKIYHNLFVESFNKKIDYQTPININRWDLLNKIIDKYNFKDYLEIGCDEDKLFSKVNIKNKIGVDPRSGGNVRKTSDQFFKNNQNFFDLVFIDGLHEYDQVVRDIENSIKFLNKKGFIFLHDCLPKEKSHQAVPRYRHFWNGDVWKAVVKFRTNKNLNIYTCNIETGIAVIKISENTDILNLKNTNFKNMKFEEYFYNHKKYMRIIDYEKFKYLFLN